MSAAALWASRLLDVATGAFLGLLGGGLVAVLANILGGTPTRMAITVAAVAAAGTALGCVWAFRRKRRQGYRPRVSYIVSCGIGVPRFGDGANPRGGPDVNGRPPA
jgi:uncharacterized membrane protein YfcA